MRHLSKKAGEKAVAPLSKKAGEMTAAPSFKKGGGNDCCASFKTQRREKLLLRFFPKKAGEKTAAPLSKKAGEKAVVRFSGMAGECLLHNLQELLLHGLLAKSVISPGRVRILLINVWVKHLN